MAKSNYSDMIALLEWVDRKTTAPKAPKGRFGKVKKPKEFDLVELLRKKKEETELLEKFLDEQSKLKKKEEKKPEKGPRVLMGIEWFVIGILSYPLVGYLQTIIPVLK